MTAAPQSSPDPIAAQQRAETPPEPLPLREALAELVALKDLKERLYGDDLSTYDMTDAQHAQAISNEYERRQPLAWESARAALATPPERAETPQASPASVPCRVYPGMTHAIKCGCVPEGAPQASPEPSDADKRNIAVALMILRNDRAEAVKWARDLLLPEDGYVVANDLWTKAYTEGYADSSANRAPSAQAKGAAQPDPGPREGLRVGDLVAEGEIEQQTPGRRDSMVGGKWYFTDALTAQAQPTARPGFAHLSRTDLRALVDHVWSNAKESEEVPGFPEADEMIDHALGDDVFARSKGAAQPDPETFEQAWARKKAEGYSYGDDALDNVRFGFEIARGL